MEEEEGCPVGSLCEIGRWEERERSWTEEASE